ncbi:MAG: SRPBCC family protein [Solirubrobacterales bacterium]|nr:SRPBCC family protein [Solirubrobacterales bacterium]
MTRCEAPPARVWGLLAGPEHWSRWSPYVRGADGLGSPEVTIGSKGHVILRGGVRIAAEITAVTPGESWTWRVGGLTIRHEVLPGPRGGSLIEHEVSGSAASRPELRDRSTWQDGPKTVLPLAHLRPSAASFSARPTWSCSRRHHRRKERRRPSA